MLNVLDGSIKLPTLSNFQMFEFALMIILPVPLLISGAFIKPNPFRVGAGLAGGFVVTFKANSPNV